MERVTRAQLVGLQVRRLNAEAATCRDADRLTAIRQEMEVLHESLLAIREEQLLEQLPKPKRRRWWRRKERACP